MKRVTVLGATGSIGRSTLDVIARHPSLFSVYALTAHSNVDEMFELCCQFHPEIVVMADAKAAARLSDRLQQAKRNIAVQTGCASMEAAAAHPEVDYVMAAIVGAAGLRPALAAAQAGKRVLLANKEALVMTGHLFMDAVAQSGATLMPIDSEHNAIFQCLPGTYRSGSTAPGVSKILLTASGGPFRQWSTRDMAQVTPAQACKHPNWTMGRKISVDSATLMNKGLELIEACWLFNTTPDRIQVVVHPQSIVHSMVEFTDGSVLAQMGSPDMRTPIAFGLGWPQRISSGVSSLDFLRLGSLEFEAPDLVRFPCLRLAQEAFLNGGTSCAILNAANEVAVEAFLNGNLGFTAIPDIIEQTLGRMASRKASSVEVVLEDDLSARQLAHSLIHRH